MDFKIEHTQLRPFHLALAVPSKDIAKTFYTATMGCTIGRESDEWVDINFFGHQITFHQVANFFSPSHSNCVDAKVVPLPHFGIVLKYDDWHKLSVHLSSQNIDFIIDPYIRFKGLKGEQATMFFRDPNGIAIELKAFKNDSCLFASEKEST